MGVNFDPETYLRALDEAFPGGPSDEEVIRFLRGAGLSIIQSTIVFAKKGLMSMSAAKEIVVESPVWQEVVTSHSDFHDALESLSKEPR